MGVRTSGWGGLPTSRSNWDEGRARAALDAWSNGDMGKYARGFLWVGGDPALKTSYKFPIAMPVNGKLTVFLSAIRAAKAYLNRGDIPSADKAKIATILDRLSESYSEDAEMSLIAGAAPVHPPKSWFTRPNITGKQKVVVTDDGHVYGWVAPDTCHRGAKASTGMCVMPPRSRNNYANFHTGTTKTAEGDLIHTGVIAWDSTHAPESYGARAAVAHYEDTSLAVADVRVGDLPGGGIWFSGAMRPDADAAAFQKMRQSPPSGDWRNLGGNLELVAVLATNNPGFPVLVASVDGEWSEDYADLDGGDRIVHEDADGRQMCLIASFAVFAEEDDEEDEDADEETEEEADDEDTEEMASKSDDEDCNCPGKKLAGYELLLTPQERAEADRLLSSFTLLEA